MPIPNAINAAPNPITDKLNNAIEPDTANNDAAIGVSTAAATVNNARPPATDIRPFNKSPQLIVLISFNDAANKLMDTVAAANAAAPFRVPFIALKPTAKIVIEPPNIIIDLATPLQLILLKVSKEPLISFIARAIANMPAALFIISLSSGINLQATPNSTNIEPNAAKPLLMSLYFIVPNVTIISASTFIPYDKANNAIPTSIISAPSVSRVKTVNIVITPPIPANPLFISFHFILPMSSITTANFFKDSAIITKLIA